MSGIGSRMLASSMARWSLVVGAAPALRRWDDEYVVHHALSNDSHRLSEPAGRMLQLLSTARVLDADELARELGLQTMEIRATLEALEELGFVTPC